MRPELAERRWLRPLILAGAGLTVAAVLAVVISGGGVLPLGADPGSSTAPAPSASAESPSTPEVQVPSCAEAAKLEGLTEVRSVPLPARANFGRGVPFDRDVGTVATPERVGYCLEETREGRTDWVFSSMADTGKASDIGLPVGPGQVTRQFAEDLTVRTNRPEVAAVQGGRGWLEMWPNSYGPAASRLVPGVWDGEEYVTDRLLDTDDRPDERSSYGSFQLHTLIDDQLSTAFAVNGWMHGGADLDVGLGTAAAGSPDWTGARNGGDGAQRRLSFYARTAPVVLEQAPQNDQVVARHGDAREVTVPVSGRIVDEAVDSVTLVVARAGRDEEVDLEVSGERFSGEVTIPVGLEETELQVRVRIGDQERTVERISGVVAGDAYLIQGQSNAEAKQWADSGRSGQNRYVRTFGSTTADAGVSTADREWHEARSDTAVDSGAVGQWAVRMGQRIVEEQQVPVALISGAHGGQAIAFYQRNDADPADPQTNYGRTLQRLDASGVRGAIRAVFWYQGETEADDAPRHITGFTSYLEDLRDDLGDPIVYVHQVRQSPCTRPERIALRDAQRRLADTHRVQIQSVTGIDATYECHFHYQNGYRDLGDANYNLLHRDFYGGPSDGVSAPDVVRARRGAAPNEIVLELRVPADQLTAEPGVGRDFRLGGQPIVTDVTWQPDGLHLMINRPVRPGDEVTYLGSLEPGPRVRNATRVGLLAFTGVLVA
ncbi:sialate O-acetylesterase [Propionibacteriaceae bacterium Y1700]|uniref:sialate O-acetylesterase n=1 Tax=Microlunatus sp. Y1700 TaxID=3418487 RepID=UPI003DA74975